MKLRDHDKPCEHPTANVPYRDPGKYWSPEGAFWGCSIVGCPGGEKVDLPADRLLQHHTLYLDDDAWTMAHPLNCSLSTCLFHEEMLIRGPHFGHSLLPDGSYAWWNIDDDPEPIG